MMIYQDPKTGDVVVNQHGYLKSMIKKHGLDELKKWPHTPATDTLTIDDNNSPDVNKTKFLSLVMALMYVARFTRPDVLMPVSYLASKSSKPSEEHMQKLIRVMKYLAGTADYGLVYKSNVPFVPVISADASHHLYP